MAFIMSLPVSAIEYTIAKMISTVGIFLLFWLTLVGVAATMILTRQEIPDGLIPLMLVLSSLILLGFVLICSVSMVKETESWGDCNRDPRQPVLQLGMVLADPNSGNRPGLISPHNRVESHTRHNPGSRIHTHCAAPRSHLVSAKPKTGLYLESAPEGRLEELKKSANGEHNGSDVSDYTHQASGSVRLANLQAGIYNLK
jgi:hypothetical protein